MHMQIIPYFGIMALCRVWRKPLGDCCWVNSWGWQEIFAILEIWGGVLWGGIGEMDKEKDKMSKNKSPLVKAGGGC